MNIYEILFTIQILIFLSLFLVKFWNVMKWGEWYSIEMVWVTFIISGFMYALSMVVVLTQPTIVIYQALFNLQTWLMGVIGVFWIAEIIFHLKKKAETAIKAYSSKEAAGKKG